MQARWTGLGLTAIDNNPANAHLDKNNETGNLVDLSDSMKDNWLILGQRGKNM